MTGDVNRTGLAEFRLLKAVDGSQPNASPKARQKGRKGDSCLSNAHAYLNQVVVRHPEQFEFTSTKAEVDCLPRTDWATSDVAGKKILFLLPSEALGSNVSTLLFLAAFREQKSPSKIGVFCARSSSDIYFTDRSISVYPLWISRKSLDQWDIVIDLGHLEARRDIDIMPLDMESELLTAFQLKPSEKYRPESRAFRPKGKPKLGLLPLATSPIRTIPVEATLQLLERMADYGEPRLFLNKAQGMGKLYAEALASRLPSAVTISDGFPSIGGLLSAIKQLDFGVFADSGPAHMSKLFGVPGVAVYSSAHGDILQGRFTNLDNWQVHYSGPHCSAPCGLAKVRESWRGDVGCMGSLHVGLDDLPNVPKGPRPDAVKNLLIDNPVPCIATLNHDPSALVEAVANKLDALTR